MNAIAYLIELPQKEGGNGAKFLTVPPTGSGNYSFEGKFSFIADSRFAIRFARQDDALRCLNAMKVLQQTLPYKDVIHEIFDPTVTVVEHAWIGDTFEDPTI